MRDTYCEPGLWIGLYQLPVSPEPDGGWVWISGDPVTYTNWAPGEPNNYLNDMYAGMACGPVIGGEWEDYYPDFPGFFKPGIIECPDCDGNGLPDWLDIACCAGATWCDCNSNGVLDECETPESIVDSDPQDGTIDARIPFEMEGGSPYGLQEIELTLDGPGASLTEQDFAVNEVGGDGTAPVVTGIESVACETVRLHLSEPIEVGAWTTVTHLDSGASVTLGYLPADADGSGCSNGNDIIQEVNLAASYAGRWIPAALQRRHRPYRHGNRQ